jgi:hypothetical protein
MPGSTAFVEMHIGSILAISASISSTRCRNFAIVP